MPTSKENISVPYLDFDPHLNPLDNPPKHRKPRKAPRREVRPVVENESAKAVMTHLPTHRRLPEERIVVNLRNGQKRLPNQNQKKEVAQLRAQAQKRKDPLRQKQNHHQAAGQRVTTHRHNITPEVLHTIILGIQAVHQAIITLIRTIRQQMYLTTIPMHKGGRQAIPRMRVTLQARGTHTSKITITHILPLEG